MENYIPLTLGKIEKLLKGDNILLSLFQIENDLKGGYVLSSQRVLKGNFVAPS